MQLFSYFIIFLFSIENVFFLFPEPLEEGVFRLSGNVQEVDDLLNRFNKGIDKYILFSQVTASFLKS